MKRGITGLREISDIIRTESRKSHPFLVGIDGLGGSGKSTLAEALNTIDSTLVIVHIDDFYLPSLMRPTPKVSIREPGSSFDLIRLADQVIKPLLSGKDAIYERYDWNYDKLAETHLVPKGSNVLIEGVFALMPSLVNMYSLRIWIECRPEVRLARGLDRDGVAERERWLKEWIPEEEQYIKIFQPMLKADIIVDGEYSFYC